MASQQILFAETIAGMKKAFKRKSYESDSDSDIENYSNRGHKLKKRARFAHQGQLVPTNGPSSYKEHVEYAGVRRPIIHRNPPLLDEEGYEIDSDDEDVNRLQEAEASAAEINPYANIQIENILAPLTASTALSAHPTLSKPFTSKTLTKLVDQSCDIMRKENRSLWQVRHLLTALCGDYTWVPCEMMVRPSDIELYTDDHVARHLLSLSKGQPSFPAIMNGDTHQQENGVEAAAADALPDVSGDGQVSDKDAAEDADVTMTDAETVGQDVSPLEGGEAPQENAGKDATTSSPQGKNKGEDQVDKTNPPVESKGELQNGGSAHRGSGSKEPADTDPSQAPEAAAAAADAHRQKDLPEASTAQDGRDASEGWDQAFVHPLFIAPSGAKPNRDVGLPDQEAEDIRRLLALYVQKQEEVCRGAKRLFLGLLKAEKLRKDVLHWSKAEAHSGVNRDMSDGEDWYDMEEWGLTENLKKGQDEEEEDTQTTGKKTRNRK
ncbi:hypothetical protein FZEAL_4170 [Fusarium zealandicum]|uniref:Transcriptional regulatory protein RXT2 N-terminal domain-containing protein n=1 Tax=Fusarium zealandicum TaxID=1053134 RepID=A0A8H4UMA8_9HYPO|nr:hypothetical protein FZEAL_4170 [Fusarium zealandicum]